MVVGGEKRKSREVWRMTAEVARAITGTSQSGPVTPITATFNAGTIGTKLKMIISVQLIAQLGSIVCVT